MQIYLAETVVCLDVFEIDVPIVYVFFHPDFERFLGIAGSQFMLVGIQRHESSKISSKKDIEKKCAHITCAQLKVQSGGSGHPSALCKWLCRLIERYLDD